MRVFTSKITFSKFRFICYRYLDVTGLKDSHLKFLTLIDIFLYSSKADFDISFNGKSKRVKHGELIYLPQNTFYTLSHLNDGNHQVYCMYFNHNEYQSSKDEEMWTKPFIIEHSSELQNVFNELLIETDNYNEANKDALCNEALTNLINYVSEFGQDNIADNYVINEDILPIVNYLNTNLYKRVAMQDILDYAGYSKAHVWSLFKHEFGVSPMFYRDCYVNAQIKIDLVNGMALSEALKRYGFTTYSTLYRQQINILGLNPSVLDLRLANNTFLLKHNKDIMDFDKVISIDL